MILAGIFEWIRAHPVLTAWLAAFSIVMFVAGVILVPILVARMPADHFLRAGPPEGSWRRRHPALRLALQLGLNLLGVVLVLAGIAMLVLPGQGILTILVGLSIMQFPGKRTLEVLLVKQPPVRKSIDWLRRRAGQDPLRLPGDES